MPDVTIGHRPNLNTPPQSIDVKTLHRRQHCLIVGKTGVGKSTLAMNMTISDLRAGAGLCFVDPHGDTVEQLLQYVPRCRTNQVLYISLADEEFPVGLNFLQPREGQSNHLVVSELVSSIRHLWADSWGPQSEFILSNAVAAVMDEADMVIVINDKANWPDYVTEGGKVVFWDIRDGLGQLDDAAYHIYGQVRQKVEELVREVG